MHHVMLDLETLGVREDSVVISLAAVGFSLQPFDVLSSIYIPSIDIDQQIKMGNTIESDSLMFWVQQIAEHGTPHWYGSQGRGISSVHSALEELQGFFRSENQRSCPVWANGAAFDFPKLDRLCRLANMPIPYSFSKQRCFRTVRNLFDPERRQAPDFIGQEHDPLADCIHQAHHLSIIAESHNLC